ncbi:uncharacterized protein LOC135161927 [Diachasmimorpha longicaudata]|uniref:uncharacterized protein LOC135161927 n=1 Tax=Diachasmimorpha longicaudata TaxID=58733 RepID=UPI0030B8DDEF
MGNAVSGGENNDDLVDILRLRRYIKTKKVERVFRAVDRGDYVLDSDRDRAYSDVSWKVGNLHLSAPCVYAKVMEGLSLEAGLSFLNVGSGTGYFSTMAGLILGHSGTNHGIELNKDCIEYAYERLAEFKQKSQAVNEFDFCEPVFSNGNFLRVIPNRQYDRVYCGAACPESQEAFIKQFVKVGGILVMPYKDHLLRIVRVDTDTWRHKAMLPVAFAALDVPKDENQTIIQLPFSEALTLQDLCRCSIRSYLRKLIWQKHPELESKTPITSDPSRNRSHPSIALSNQSMYQGSVTRISVEDEEDDDSSTTTRLLVCMNSPSHSSLHHLVRSLAPLRPLSDPEDSGTDEEVEPVMSKEIPIDSMLSSSSSSLSSLGDPLSSSNCPKNGRNNAEDEPMLVDEPESSATPNDEETNPFSDENNVCHEPSSTGHHPQMNHAMRLVSDGSNVNSDKSNSSQSESNCTSAKNGVSLVAEKSFKRDNDNTSTTCKDSGEGTSSERDDFRSPAMKKKLRKLLPKREIDEDWSANRLGDGSADGNQETSPNLWNFEDSSDEACGPSKFGTPKWNTLTGSSGEDDEDSGNERSKDPDVSGINDFRWNMIWDSLFDLDPRMNGNDGSSTQVRGSSDAPRNRSSQVFAHNVHADNLAEEMHRTIQALPLPTSLQLYINYNRPL